MIVGKYRIQFQHENNTQIKQNSTTYCKISVVGPNIESEEVVSLGRSVCHIGDNFSKEIGRKLSLKRALLGKAHFEEGRVFNKRTRKAIWEAYRTHGRQTPRWGTNNN